MLGDEKIKVIGIAYHRNGISGEGFHIVKFAWEGRRMVGIVFDAPYHVAVFDLVLLSENIIEFGVNSWRGDDFEKPLRDAIASWEYRR